MTEERPQIGILHGGHIVPVSQETSTELGEPHARGSLIDLVKNAIEDDLTVRTLRHLPQGSYPFDFVLVPANEVQHSMVVLSGRNVCRFEQQPSAGHDPIQTWSLLCRLAPDFPVRLAQRSQDRSEQRIDKILDLMLDSDPFGPIEARIDATNAEMRAEFLKDFPVLDSAQVHDRAGLKGGNKSQTVNTWRQKGRILGLPIQNKIGYPDFQFDADGRPLKLMQQILNSLPSEYSPWQKAFWMVSSQEALDGRTPLDALREGDDHVVDAAARADELPVG